MNTQEFSSLLKNPSNISAKQLRYVQSIINKFPYFQSARAIYLKGLKDKGSFKYNQELKTTAAHTTDRSILFNYITSKSFLQNIVSEQIKENTKHLKDIEVKDVEDISVKSIIIDNALKQHFRDSEATTDPGLFEAKNVTTQNLKNPFKEVLELGRPLDFDENEVHSFSEWLKITSFKPILRNEPLKENHQSNTQQSLEKKLNLIDKFIESKPQIKPIKQEGEIINLADRNNIQPETLMTETLARIYLEQKQYEKAIQSYKILSLKYPEKSGFFADQIRAIKQMLE